MATTDSAEGGLPERWVLVLLIGLYVALSTRAITILSVGWGVTITAAYLLVAAILVGITGHIMTSEHVRITRISLVVMVLFAAFLMVVGIQATRSPQPLRGLTLTGIVGFGFVVYAFPVLTLRRDASVRRLNYYVYVSGAILSTLGVVGYMLTIGLDTTVGSVLGGRFDNWQLFAMPANAILYRYTGFVGDPNFAPWYAGVALICGIVSSRGRQRSGLVPIVLAIFLSMSRTFFGVLIIALCGILLVTRMSPDASSVGQRVTAVFWSIAGVGIGVTLFGLVISTETVVKWLQRRLFATLFNDRRFIETWPRLLREAVEQPLFGKGSRAVEATLGQTAHSAYVGLFYDFGILGLALWLALLLSGVWVSLRLVANGRDAALPWLFGLLTVLGMNVMNSFQFDLFNWFVLGVALSPGHIGTGLLSTVTFADGEQPIDQVPTPSAEETTEETDLT